MMEIFWTMLASQDRKRIREYIAEQNLMAAIELDERIGYSASSLAGQPYKCHERCNSDPHPTPEIRSRE